DVAGNDRKFDEADVEQFLRQYYDTDASNHLTNIALEPNAVEYGRYDLNGDGFTGGSSLVNRFDLDRVGSSQFGSTQYTTISRNMLGKTIAFDENQVKDVDILCYYAYSALYTGDPDARDELTAGICAPISVTVTPATVTVPPGGTASFTATVAGRRNAQ